jgi:hypothetical protein
VQEHPRRREAREALPTPFSMPVTSRCGVVSVLPSLSAPVASSNAATSVKVPPTSADRRIAESRNGNIHRKASLYMLDRCITHSSRAVPADQ